MCTNKVVRAGVAEGKRVVRLADMAEKQQSYPARRGDVIALYV